MKCLKCRCTGCSWSLTFFPTEKIWILERLVVRMMKMRLAFGFKGGYVMKIKSLFWGLFSLVLVSSCSEVKEINENENTVNRHRVNPEFMTLNASLDEGLTKTDYDGAGKFTWVNSDRVALIVQKKGDADYQNFYSMSTSDLQITNEGKDAEFTNLIEYDEADPINPSEDPEYVSTGFAVYPNYIVPTHTDSGYGGPYVKIPHSSRGTIPANAGELSSIILTGTNAGSYFSFKTAASILKINIKKIPAETTKLLLCTTNKQYYPVDGDFMLRTNVPGYDGIAVISLDTYDSTWYGDNLGYQAVAVTTGGVEVASKDFYFNVPVGEYPEGVLSIKLLNSSDECLFVASINAPLSFERNEVLSIPSITVPSSEWISVGTGYYYDGTVWNSNNPVEVAIERSRSDINSFRIPNPYIIAGSSKINGYANSAVVTGDYDEYMFFTTAGSSVSFSTLKTGFTWTASATTRSIKFAHPSVYSADASHNVVRAENGIPCNIRFAGYYYGYEGSTDYTGWNWNRSSSDNVFLGFPIRATKKYEIPLTESMLSALSTQTGDGDRLTFWHSQYSPVVDKDATYGIYVDITLASAINEFSLDITGRHNNNNGSPASIKLYVWSESESDWKCVSGISRINLDISYQGRTVSTPTVSSVEAFDKIRIAILSDRYNGDSFSSTHIAQLKLYGK